MSVQCEIQQVTLHPDTALWSSPFRSAWLRSPQIKCTRSSFTLKSFREQQVTIFSSNPNPLPAQHQPTKPTSEETQTSDKADNFLKNWSTNPIESQCKLDSSDGQKQDTKGLIMMLLVCLIWKSFCYNFAGTDATNIVVLSVAFRYDWGLWA